MPGVITLFREHIAPNFCRRHWIGFTGMFVECESDYTFDKITFTPCLQTELGRRSRDDLSECTRGLHCPCLILGPFVGEVISLYTMAEKMKEHLRFEASQANISVKA